MKLSLDSLAAFLGLFRGRIVAVLAAGGMLAVCGAAAALEFRPFPPDQAAALGVPASAPASTQRFVYTLQPNAATQSAGPVTVGQNIQIRAAGNATTGFAWAVKDVQGDAVKTAGEVKYLREPTLPRPRVPGAGGTYFIPLEAVKAGQARVTLVYARVRGNDAGQDATLASTVTLTIDVRDAAAPPATTPATTTSPP